MAISHSPAPSVPTNWSCALRALLAACAMASLWFNYGTTPALFAAVGVALYATIGPLQLGTLIFSRRTATLFFRWGVYFVAAIIVFNVVGYATESPVLILSSLANVAFISGLAVVGVVVVRAIWRAIIRLSVTAPGVWSSVEANLQSQIRLLYLYVRRSADLSNENHAQGSFNRNVDPQ